MKQLTVEFTFDPVFILWKDNEQVNDWAHWHGFPRPVQHKIKEKLKTRGPEVAHSIVNYVSTDDYKLIEGKLLSGSYDPKTDIIKIQVQYTAPKGELPFTADKLEKIVLENNYDGADTWQEGHTTLYSDKEHDYELFPNMRGMKVISSK